MRLYRYLPCKLPGQVQERFLKIVVALCRYLIVLKVLLPMEGHLLSFNLPVLHINLVPTENNGYVLTNPDISRVKCTKLSINGKRKQ